MSSWPRPPLKILSIFLTFVVAGGLSIITNMQIRSYGMKPLHTVTFRFFHSLTTTTSLCSRQWLFVCMR
jgi:hypothetical protein